MKLKLPKFEEFNEVYWEEDDSKGISGGCEFNVWHVVIDTEWDEEKGQPFVYGMIIPRRQYYEDAFVLTDDIYVAHETRRCFKVAYSKVIKQLCDRYKKFVKSLYENKTKAVCSECGSPVEIAEGEEWGYCPMCENDQVELKRKAKEIMKSE